MSDINLDFTVSNNSIDFTVQPNDITITPEEIQLTFNANFQPLAGGSNTQLQYNLNGTLDGIPNVTYNGSNISLGNVSTVKITGGVNGYVLQTDGTGNLDWTAMTGGGGNGTPGGSNTQIQYNDNGTFGGNAGFTFNEVTGNVAIPGNLSVAGNILGFVANANYAAFAGNANTAINANYAAFAGNVTIASQPNITSLGNLTSLTVIGNSNTGNIYTSGVSGNISGANVISANTFTAAANITANYFIGNGSQLTGLPGGSNISNGTSSVNIATANGNVTVTAGGTTSLTISNSNVTGRQFVSNVATGNAPFIVTSTTLVANLRVANAVFANGANSAFSAVTASNVNGSGSSIVGSLTANGFVVPLSNNTSTLGFTGQRFANLFVGNIFFSGNLTGGPSAPVAAVTTTPTNKLPIDIGGVTYYICLTSAI